MSNSIDITRPATLNAAAPGKAVASNKPKAQFWLNIGYEVEVQTSEGAEKKFINLPMGLALDSMDEVPTTSSNQIFAAMQIAKNDLLKQLLGVGADLAPGEERLVNLQVQLRRVNDASKNASLADPDVNPFLRKLTF